MQSKTVTANIWEGKKLSVPCFDQNLLTPFLLFAMNQETPAVSVFNSKEHSCS